MVACYADGDAYVPCSAALWICTRCKEWYCVAHSAKSVMPNGKGIGECAACEAAEEESMASALYLPTDEGIWWPDHTQPAPPLPYWERVRLRLVLWAIQDAAKLAVPDGAPSSGAKLIGKRVGKIMDQVLMERAPLHGEIPSCYQRHVLEAYALLPEWSVYNIGHWLASVQLCDDWDDIDLENMSGRALELYEVLDRAFHAASYPGRPYPEPNEPDVLKEKQQRGMP